MYPQVTRASGKSKKWCKENPGKYPPALDPVLAKKKAFSSVHGTSPTHSLAHAPRLALPLGVSHWQVSASMGGACLRWSYRAIAVHGARTGTVDMRDETGYSF